MTARHVTPEGIVDALERAHAAAGDAQAILAFDADGTLWAGDIGIDMYEALLAAGDLRDAAREALAAEARAHGVEDGGDASAIARRLYARYQARAWPLDRAFATMAWSTAGFHVEEVDAYARRVVEVAGLARRLRAGLGPAQAWARDRGVETWVVSASPIAIVTHGASLVGIPRERVVAMSPAVDAAGVVEPRLAGHVVYGEGKLEALRAARPGVAILAAFGDSAYDAAMLRAARVAVAVAPSAGLEELLDTIPGVVVLPAEDGASPAGH